MNKNENNSLSYAFSSPIIWCPPLLGALLLITPESISTNFLILFSSSSVKNLYYSIVHYGLLFQLPIFAWRLSKTTMLKTLIENTKKMTRIKKIRLYFGTCCLTIISVFTFFFVKQDPSFCEGCTTNSLFGMIFYNTGLPLIICLFVSGAFTLLKNAPYIFSINNHNSTVPVSNTK